MEGLATLELSSRKRSDLRFSVEGLEAKEDAGYVDAESGFRRSDEPCKPEGQALRKRSGCIRKSVSARLVHVDKTPPWYKARDHVLSGYRIGHSARDCVVGLLEWHGETVNIWTHLVALPITLIAIMDLLQHPLAEQVHPWVRVGGVLCCSTAVNLLAWSILAHVFHCLSPWHQN